MTEPQVQSINKGGLDQTESKTRTAKELIQTEWKIIDALQNLAQNARYDKQKAFYYQTLASYIRTLSTLLKLHTQPDQTQDLATLLSQIQTQAKTLAKRLLASGGFCQKHEEFMKKIAQLNNESLAKVLKRLSFMAQTKVYLFWSKKKKVGVLTW